MKKTTIILVASVFLVGILIVATYKDVSRTSDVALRGQWEQESRNPKYHASTTRYTVTFGAEAGTRLVATSTATGATATLPETSGRSALRLEIDGCGANGRLWLGFNDVPVATTTGQYRVSSTTPTNFGNDVPMINGSIRAFADSANCTVVVTEVRTEN